MFRINLRMDKMEPKRKKIYIFGIVFVVAILFIAFLLTIKNNDKNDIRNSVNENKNISTTENKENIYNNETFIPPKMENNPFVEKDKDEAIKNSTNLNTEEPKIKDITNYENTKQEDIVRQISKMQKPSDMIAFLKEKQSEFLFNGKEKSFKFDLKEYVVGDKFLDFFEIILISPNFIRFKDDSYEYNLRFLNKD